MSAPPGIVIEIRLEERVRVVSDFRTDGDAERLGIWFARSRPTYWELIERAMDLAEQAAEDAA
jgi:hypothetical protein